VWLLLVIGFVAALPFDARISSDTQAVNPTFLGARFDVDFALTNVNSEPLTICTWGTPLDKSSDVMRANMFSAVSTMGEEAVYTGIVMKRRPVLSDFITLQPGQTIQGSVNLLKGYWFPGVGHYTVALRSYIYVLAGEVELEQVVANGLQNFQLYDLSSEAIIVNVLDVKSAPDWGEYNETRLGTITPAANCDSTRTTNLRTSDTNAGSLISRVNTYLRNSCSGGNYVTWMGACDSNRYATVQRNFQNIGSRQSAGYRADCAGSSCSANTYAYVFPSDSTFTVYVCGAFWNAPIGTCAYDSKPGTIIHEISHFTPVAGTQDIAYGTTACRNLATSNPANAVRNADSHEYLAESCP